MKANPLYVCDVVEADLNDAAGVIDKAIDQHLKDFGPKGVIKIARIVPKNMIVGRLIVPVYEALGWKVLSRPRGASFKVELWFH